MQNTRSSTLFTFGRKALTIAAMAFGLAWTTPVAAQQLSTQQGMATKLDLQETARTVSMRNMYSRALYLYLRSNPTKLNDQQTFVNFLIFLMEQSPGFDCRQAFANEFERRDFFTNAFALQAPLQQIVNSVRIPERFDIAFSIDTGEYDFSSGNLPFDRVASVGLGGDQLSTQIRSSGGQRCAQEILRGTSVDPNVFPWSFNVVNEEAQNAAAQFPFGRSMQLSSNDARVLFERFGRRLYAIVSYQFQSANDGRPLIQVVPTDAQMFGLSSDAVVRVNTFAHPTKSQPNYLDIKHQLQLDLTDFNMKMKVDFDQDGFRAVAEGSRSEAGTDITQGGTFAVKGSAAVGNSVFIMRYAVPEPFQTQRGILGTDGSKTFLTLFGSVDFEKLSPNKAPVSGVLNVLRQAPGSFQLEEMQQARFEGFFTPAGAEEPTEEPVAAEPESQLD